MNFDAVDYRKRVAKWRERYEGISRSIRMLKRCAAFSAQAGNQTGSADLQRALTVLQDESRIMLYERQEMKDEWNYYNNRPVFALVVLGDVIFS